MNDKNIINLQYTTIKDPLPDFIYDDIKVFCANANTYRPQPVELISLLAKKHGLPPEMIFITPGIDEAIYIFIRAYGKETHIFTPTYVVYAEAETLGNRLIKIPSIVNNDYVVNTTKLKKASLIFLANPNNPSGFTPKNKVREFIKNNSHTKVVIDEAYGDFADLSIIDEVKKFPHIAVFKSFSKGYGMAGNRLGYIIANERIISEIRKYTTWANASYLSVGAGISALNHEEYFEKMRKLIAEKRENLNRFLNDGGYITIPSLINAVLIKFPSIEAADSFVKHLNKNNVVVSQGDGNSNIGMDKSYVRMAIGTDEQIVKLKKIIGDYREK